jgi:hypothetical protein
LLKAEPSLRFGDSSVKTWVSLSTFRELAYRIPETKQKADKCFGASASLNRTLSLILARNLRQQWTLIHAQYVQGGHLQGQSM